MISFNYKIQNNLIFSDYSTLYKNYKLKQNKVVIEESVPYCHFSDRPKSITDWVKNFK